MKRAILIIPLILVAAGLTVFGCVRWVVPAFKTIKSDVQKVHITEPTAGELTIREETMDYSTDLSQMSPLGFIDYLKSKPDGIIMAPHVPEGWISWRDVEGLIKLADSNEQCACVVSGLSSFIPKPGSTVGNEAMFLLDGYKCGSYPPVLTSKSEDKKDPSEYRKWFKEVKAENRIGFYEARQKCSAVYLAGGTRPEITGINAEDRDKVYTVTSQDEMKAFMDGFSRRVALWIDISAASGVDKEWLGKMAHKDRCPVIAIGSASAEYSFRDALGICSNMNGSFITLEERNRQGFSVYRLTNDEIMRGFAGPVSPDEVLKVSDMLYSELEVFQLNSGSPPEQTARYHYWALKSDSGSRIDNQGLIDILPSVDWSLLSLKSADDLFGIMSWFADQSVKGNEKAAASFMKSRTGLDGAYAEGYSAKLAEMLEKNPETFIKTLAKLDKKDIDDITMLLIPELVYNKQLQKKLTDYGIKPGNETVRQIISKLLDED